MMPISFGTNLGSSLEDELQALFLQNLINSQMPMPAYDVYGLPDKAGRVPRYTEPGGPAPPNPAIADIIQKLAGAQATRAQGGLFGAHAGAVAGEEGRTAETFDVSRPYMERSADIDFRNKLLERDVAFSQNEARKNIILNAVQEKDPRWRAMNMAMALRQPSPQLPQDEVPGQKFAGIAKMGEAELTPLAVRYAKLIENLSNPGYGEKEKKAMRKELALLEQQLSAIRDYYSSMMGSGGNAGDPRSSVPRSQFTEQSSQDSISELNKLLGLAWRPVG